MAEDATALIGRCIPADGGVDDGEWIEKVRLSPAPVIAGGVPDDAGRDQQSRFARYNAARPVSRVVLRNCQVRAKEGAVVVTSA